MDKEFLPETEEMERKYRKLQGLIARRLIHCKDKYIKKLFSKYGAKVFRRCSAPADWADVVFEKTMKGKSFTRALEIGTLNGITAAVMSQYVQKVYTFDIIDYPLKYEIWDYLGVRDKIDFHLVTGELEKEKIINSLRFQIAYVDGNHLHHTWSDFMATRSCGKIIFHEATEEASQVKLLVEELPEKEVTYFTNLCDAYKNQNQTCSMAYWEKK